MKDLIDKLISPNASKYGLKWRGNYYWVGENINGIRNEYSEGYAKSFVGEKMVDGNGVASHYSQVAEKTITQAIEGELNNIASFFKRANSIEGIIQIAEDQIKNPKFPIYNMKFPSQEYILSFNYARNNAEV